MASRQFTIRKVAVVDDDPAAFDATSISIEDAGLVPISVGAHFKEPGELVSRVVATADAAVCDHRLSPRGLASFSGAEAVAALFEQRFPAVLTTTYFAMDADVSIRRWRARVPVLLSRDQMDPDTLWQALRQCQEELDGKPAADRVPWRTLIRIDNLTQESGVDVVDAIVPGWNPRSAVRFPTELIPDSLRQNLVSGSHLFAKVNVGAERDEDLFFQDFESAPDPDPNNGL